MAFRYSIKNDQPAELRIWVEPFCNQYTVRPGATLILMYEASEDENIEVELTAEQMTLFLNADYEPDAEMDGRSIDPDMQ